MATPEQNALLALQLFGAPADQFNQQNNARTSLLLNLTNRNRDEQLKRDLADLSYQKAIELAGLSADREDARQLGFERRQKSQNEAKDKADVLNEIDRLYPQYAAAAARSNIPIKERTEFAETRAGLGQLAAELRTAEVGFENKRLQGAADAIMSEYEDGRKAVEAERARFDALGQPSKDDQKFARTRAVAALKQAIESGTIESAKKLSKKAVSDGLAALSKGDDTIAQNLLGEEALGAFQSAIEQTLMALPNTKSRLQERAQAQQRLLALQGQTSRIESDVRKAAAVNPFLAEQFKAKSPLTELMTSPGPQKSRTFDQITPPPASAQPTPAAGGQPTTQTSAPAYKYPALSVLGLAERGPSASEYAMAPANILAFPGRVLDAAGRYGGAALNGLVTGDYTVPPVGLIESAGRGIGAMMAPDPFAAPPAAPAPQRSLFGADNPGRQADIDRQAALIEWLLSNGQK